MDAMRSLSEAFHRGDIDGEMRLFAPYAVWEDTEIGATLKGVEAIRGFLEEWRGRYAEYGVQTGEALDLGNGVGFAITRETVSLADDLRQAPVHADWSYTFVVDQGAIVRVIASPSLDDARTFAERLAEERG